MSRESNSAYQGPSGLFLFFLVLFVLKVTGPLARLSWWWVTAPLWGGLVLVLLVILGLLGALGVATLFDVRRRRRVIRQRQSPFRRKGGPLA